MRMFTLMMVVMMMKVMNDGDVHDVDGDDDVDDDDDVHDVDGDDDDDE